MFLPVGALYRGRVSKHEEEARLFLTVTVPLGIHIHQTPFVCWMNVYMSRAATPEIPLGRVIYYAIFPLCNRRHICTKQRKYCTNTTIDLLSNRIIAVHICIMQIHEDRTLGRLVYMTPSPHLDLHHNSNAWAVNMDN